MPNSKFKLLSDLLIAFTCISHFYILILDLCFHLNQRDFTEFSEFYTVWAKSILVLFIFDLLQKFNSGHFKHGSLMLDRRQIIQKYLKSAFIFDLIVCISLLLSCFPGLFPASKAYKVLLNLAFFLKYPLLDELLVNFEEILNFDQKLEALSGLVKLFIKMLFLAHIVACLWLTLGYMNRDGPNWLSAKGVQGQHIGLNYELSLYWAFVTLATIGYGDITPQNRFEYLFSLCVIVLGSIFFGYSLSCIASILNYLEKEATVKK